MRDALLKDAIESAKLDGKRPVVQDAQDYLSRILGRIEQSRAEAKPANTPSQSKAEKAFEKYTGDKLDPAWKVERGGDRLAKVDDLRRVGEQRLRLRLAWIAQRPELETKLKAITIRSMSPVAEVQRKAGDELKAFLEHTNKLAGYDWRQPKPKKLIF